MIISKVFVVILMLMTCTRNKEVVALGRYTDDLHLALFSTDGEIPGSGGLINILRRMTRFKRQSEDVEAPPIPEENVEITENNEGLLDTVEEGGGSIGVEQPPETTNTVIQDDPVSSETQGEVEDTTRFEGNPKNKSPEKSVDDRKNNGELKSKNVILVDGFLICRWPKNRLKKEDEKSKDEKNVQIIDHELEKYLNMFPDIDKNNTMLSNTSNTQTIARAIDKNKMILDILYKTLIESVVVPPTNLKDSQSLKTSQLQGSPSEYSTEVDESSTTTAGLPVKDDRSVQERLLHHNGDLSSERRFDNGTGEDENNMSVHHYMQHHLGVRLAPAYTVYGQPCVDQCESRGHAYTWCTIDYSSSPTEEEEGFSVSALHEISASARKESNAKWWSQSTGYCTTSSQYTPFKERCLNKCSARGYPYSWCKISTVPIIEFSPENANSWGYCTPNHLVHRADAWQLLITGGP